MKKLIFMMMTAAMCQLSYGQLNPVNNLEWSHWYVCPNNYFILSWDMPVVSQDTLIGFNIYREMDLYRFQAGTSLYHTETGGNCDEDFVWYNGGQSFWMHVCAIYNFNHQQSCYIDSAYCYGYAIGIDEREQPAMKLYPNPSTGKFKIDSDFTIRRIEIMNPSGGVIQEERMTSELDLSHLPKGLYFIKAYADEGMKVKAVMLE